MDYRPPFGPGNDPRLDVTFGGPERSKTLEKPNQRGILLWEEGDFGSGLDALEVEEAWRRYSV
jgi:hypothetical protein